MYSLILSDAYAMAISSCIGGCYSKVTSGAFSGHPYAYSKICTQETSQQPEKDFGSFCDIKHGVLNNRNG